MTDKFADQREEIEGMGLDVIKKFFGIDVAEIDPKITKLLHNKARIAMQFEKEMLVTKRHIEKSYLRVFRMIAEDKRELKQYIKKSLPQYYPVRHSIAQ